MKSKNPKNKLNNYAKYSSLTFQMAIIIIAGVFGGLKIDEYFNTKPVFTLILSILSVVIAVYFAIKDLININK